MAIWNWIKRMLGVAGSWTLDQLLTFVIWLWQRGRAMPPAVQLIAGGATAGGIVYYFMS